VKKFSYAENTSSFDRLSDMVAEEGQPVVVSRWGAEPVIMMPLSEWRSV
jgi:PHD/YefM family antitoxin component YafN of YafNO toxin-antitoxin module